MVIVFKPADAVECGVTVIVEVQLTPLGVQLTGEKETATPEAAPEDDNVTGTAVPATRVTVTTEVVEELLPIVAEEGLADIEKLKASPTTNE